MSQERVAPAKTTRTTRMRRKELAALALLVVLQTASAASDGWTPIIPEGVPGSSGSSSHGGRHALAVEPGLPGSLAASLSSLSSSLGASSYHSHVDHVVGHSHVFRPRPSKHHAAPSPLPSIGPSPDFPKDFLGTSLGPQHPAGDHGDTCSLYKAAMTQDLYFQYIQYKVHMPDLKEFTLCMWHKFYNHSSDHPLFSYAIHDTPRAILSWVSATDRSTYFSMSVDGHTLFRLNYPLRLNRWYHSCQSWNGRTGEWQVWVNAERVGRGFHNLLVNHVIKGGGVAITGQEQRQYGGGFLEGEGAPKGAGGMLGEITQLQMYTVALTAGKAYRDHKHHHGNYAGEPGQAQRTTTTTPAPMPETTPVNPYAPFITNGQLTPQLPIFELSAFRKNIPMPPGMEDAQASNAQASPSAAPTAGAMLDLSQLLAAVSYLHMSPTAGGASVRIPLLTHSRPALDLDPQQHYLFKRDDTVKGADQPDDPAKKQEKRDTAAATDDKDAVVEAEDKKPEPTVATKVKRSADPAARADDDEAKQAEVLAAEVEPQRLSGKHAKRESKRLLKSAAKPTSATAPQPADEAVDIKPSSQTKRETDDEVVSDTKKKRQTISLHGGPIDLGGDIDTSLLSQGLSGLLPHGEFLGAGGATPGPLAYVEFHGNNHQQLLSLPQPSKMPQAVAQAGPPGPPPKPLKRENEPAEGEVMAVMAMCSGCAPDPFAKVNVISWQGTPKKLYSGVHYVPAKPVCRKF
ncbi:uncharacterized protein LOC117642405 [Thrips palmi]|uniref:Uncharacterized protein LOC117642405 n=1 Tax=Thrips palmi TaxID=161013 RepID=A0A6P8YQY5_THRPL|nr:uncharacterized protein LOC117642405 [Thrips palmi]